MPGETQVTAKKVLKRGPGGAGGKSGRVGVLSGAVVDHGGRVLARRRRTRERIGGDASPSTVDVTKWSPALCKGFNYK